MKEPHMSQFNDGRIVEKQENWLKVWFKKQLVGRLGCGSDHDRVVSEDQQTMKRKISA